jgi:hypothetical protein
MVSPLMVAISPPIAKVVEVFVERWRYYVQYSRLPPLFLD